MGRVQIHGWAGHRRWGFPDRVCLDMLQSIMLVARNILAPAKPHLPISVNSSKEIACKQYHIDIIQQWV